MDPCMVYEPYEPYTLILCMNPYVVYEPYTLNPKPLNPLTPRPFASPFALKELGCASQRLESPAIPVSSALGPEFRA